MSSIEQIINEMQAIDSRISTYELHIQREKSELTNVMHKAQSAFGDQRAGQHIVTSLYRALQNLVAAEGSLNCVKQQTHSYIQNLQK